MCFGGSVAYNTNMKASHHHLSPLKHNAGLDLRLCYLPNNNNNKHFYSVNDAEFEANGCFSYIYTLRIRVRLAKVKIIYEIKM